MAEAYLAEAITTPQSLDAAAQAMCRVFPTAVAQYAQMGRSSDQVRAEHDSEEPERRPHAKVSRNAPCPCGSGKKYKQCCGMTVH